MKTLFKAIGIAASLGLGAVLVSGCNPDEPAKPMTPPPAPPVAVKPAPKADTPPVPVAKPETKTEPKVEPPKPEEKK